MARELLVRTWCDVCMSDDVRAAAERVTVALDSLGMRATSVDLCDDHRKQLVDPLVAALTEHGASPEDERPRQPRQQLRRSRAAVEADPSAVTCPLDGHKAPTANAMHKHCLAIHQQSWDDVKGTSTLWCPQCGLGWERNRGLSMHLRSAHNVSAIEAKRLLNTGQLATRPT